MRRYTGLIAVLFFLGADIHAQISLEPVGSDSVKKALLPVAGYDSDIGFLGGVLYNRIDYRGKARPFNYYINSSFTASTKGMFNLEFEYDQTESFNSDIRSVVALNAYRFTHDYYFGIGNQSDFDQQGFDDDFYFFESLSFSLDYDGRLPLHSDDNSSFDLLFGLGTKYETSSVKQDSSRFNFDRPRGFNGGWVNALKTGFIWENRNSEFDPTAGNRFELELRGAPEFLFSDFGLVTIETDYRHYFRLFNWVTFANRLQLRHATGDIPYWELSRLGDPETLRGYPLNRFMGNSSAAYTLEVRKWLIVFPEYSIKIGGHLFTDVGRVFTEEDGFGDILKGYKQTVGLGGALSLFSPDFILRGEAGFSEDMMRIYVGIGYTF